MNLKTKGILMVILGASFWGLLSTFSQILMQDNHMDPSWLITVRLLVSGLLILVGISIKKSSHSIWNIWRDKEDWIGIILLGLLGFLGVQYTYFVAIQTGNAVTTSLLHFLGPSIVLLYFSIRKKKFPSKFECLILVLASIGTFLLVTNGSVSQLTVPAISLFWGVISAISGAFYLIYPVRMIKKWGAYMIVGWGMLIGGLIMSIFTPLWHVPKFNAYTLFLLTYIIIFGTLFGFVLYLGSLKYIKSIEAGILSCIEPFVAAISSYFLLQRTFGLYEILGGLFILLTVFFISWMRDSNKPDTT